MLKISDFSQLGRASVRTLHHYDEWGLLKPVKIDSVINCRFYLLDRLPRLNRILAPEDLGLSLDQISGLVEDELPPDQLRGILKMRRSEIEQQLRKAAGTGFDAVFEGSGSGLSRCLVKRGGILVSYGFTGMLREKGGSRLGFRARRRGRLLRRIPMEHPAQRQVLGLLRRQRNAQKAPRMVPRRHVPPLRPAGAWWDPTCRRPSLLYRRGSPGPRVARRGWRKRPPRAGGGLIRQALAGRNYSSFSEPGVPLRCWPRVL